MSEQVTNKPATKTCMHCQTAVPVKATRCPQCQGDLRSWINRHPILTFIIIIFGIPILLSTGFSGLNTADETPSTTTADASLDPETRKIMEDRLMVLKKNFNYKYDEFEKKGWYIHKNQTVQNSYNRNYLGVMVNNVGYAYLESNYYGSSWIFHTGVEVKIGDTVYKTEDIPSYDKNNVRIILSGAVSETISYTAGRDNGVLEAIAKSGENIVRVRFSGSDNVKDITLSQKDKEAIKDSYELAELIKKLGDTGAVVESVSTEQPKQTNTSPALVSKAPVVTSSNKIEGLGAISIGNNVRNNRLILTIIYEKSDGSFLSVKDHSLPISAKVNIYKLDMLNKNTKELIFSKSGLPKNINITKNASPELIINPREINLSTVDSKNHMLLIEVLINTPEQGNFSATKKVSGSELDAIKYACAFVADCK